MRVFCGEFPNDDVDDCEFPETPEGTKLAVGYRHLCPRCGRKWELVDMFDSTLWQSTIVTDGDGNRVQQ